MNTLQYILDKFKLEADGDLPIQIPDFGRDQMAGLFAELDFKVGAEIGVEQGVYSEILCKANTGLSLHCIDAWQHYPGYRDHVGQEKLDGFYEAAKSRLKPYSCHMVRSYSMEAVKGYIDRTFDFVYIDGNHEFPWVVEDIFHWSKKVKKGGIVSGHDYRRSKRADTRNHVTYVVDAYTAAYRIKPWFVLGLQAKNLGQIRDEARSWMWIKP